MTLSDYKIYSTSKQAWDAMHRAILGAEKSIYWELYIFVDDEAGKPFFDLLEKKASEDLDVKLIVDYWGSFGLSRKRIASLKKAGVDVKLFSERKLRYRGLWKRFITINHRKILIVDEQIGFIGGVNIQSNMEDWLDIQVELKGKAVRSLLRSFAKQYIICGGKKSKVKHLFKYKFRVESDKFDFIYDDSSDKRSRMRKKYSEALLRARERVVLFSPYYFPDKKFIYALWKARKRGVKIDLLIPFRSDVKVANYAMYGWFSLLKKMGVKIHMTSGMMHGKGMIVDDDLAIVGSSNLDQTSFYDNYEANVQIRDKRLIRNLKSVVHKWIKKAKKFDDIILETGKWHKVKEKIAFKMHNIWYRNK